MRASSVVPAYDMILLFLSSLALFLTECCVDRILAFQRCSESLPLTQRTMLVFL